jgi:hypothetical protein
LRGLRRDVRVRVGRVGGLDGRCGHDGDLDRLVGTDAAIARQPGGILRVGSGVGCEVAGVAVPNGVDGEGGRLGRARFLGMTR